MLSSISCHFGTRFEFEPTIVLFFVESPGTQLSTYSHSREQVVASGDECQAGSRRADPGRNSAVEYPTPRLNL